MPKKPLAYDAYQLLADDYARLIGTKPHNAWYERPATLALLPSVIGMHVLDAGCGPGVYAEELFKRGAQVVSVDASDRMIELARERLGPNATIQNVDLSRPLTMFRDGQFDLVLAPLCVDYINDWLTLFSEFGRVLKPRGYFVMSAGHPAFEAEYFSTSNYFSVERVECEWTGFGTKVTMPSYRRSLEEFLTPIVRAGFHLEEIVEPLPTDEFKEADPVRYTSLMHRPAFLCVRARKPS